MYQPGVTATILRNTASKCHEKMHSDSAGWWNIYKVSINKKDINIINIYRLSIDKNGNLSVWYQHVAFFKEWEKYQKYKKAVHQRFSEGSKKHYWKYLRQLLWWET